MPYALSVCPDDDDADNLQDRRNSQFMLIMTESTPHHLPRSPILPFEPA